MIVSYKYNYLSPAYYIWDNFRENCSIYSPLYGDLPCLNTSPFIGNPDYITHVDAGHVVICATKGNALSSRTPCIQKMDFCIFHPPSLISQRGMRLPIHHPFGVVRTSPRSFIWEIFFFFFKMNVCFDLFIIVYCMWAHISKRVIFDYLWQAVSTPIRKINRIFFTEYLILNFFTKLLFDKKRGTYGYIRERLILGDSWAPPCHLLGTEIGSEIFNMPFLGPYHRHIYRN